MIQVQNRYLPTLIPFLEGMKLAGTASRARSKLLSLVIDAYSALAISERELVKEHAVLNEKGEPHIAEDGTFELKDPQLADDYLTAREALISEHAILTPAYAEHPAQLLELLENYTVELSGDEAAVYDHLYDQILKAVEGEQ
ncbi:DUF1617 family protein [Trueperella pyogenes]|uniref:DUF1617 family protein n=1 Tax=Trueperella pyogenes TaxID=1661 RepID=UPI000D52ECDF|nr:DUF1617 family protein [Trueperella pyogenes]AWG03440.1 hypothetical protein DC090_02740 [Trueperella pyogenes]AWG16171.1 hypothetical protein DDE06_04665 [Trueperella pyogenes]AZR05054.1 DUF1617 family protein [Trueperella pyogenes]